MPFSRFSVLSGRATEPDAHKVREHGGHHYDPDQPRVPVGYRDGGQWTSGSYGPSSKRSDKQSGVVLAANEPRVPGPPWVSIGVIVLFQAIKWFLKSKRVPDMFGNDPVTDNATGAAMVVNGKMEFGVNSGHHNYDHEDRKDAEDKRDNLIRKRPDIMRLDNIGKTPNDALFHAEATILLRAARKNGGTLTGQRLEVAVNKPLCPSCRDVLPHLAKEELGNPMVTFIDPQGRRMTMHDGKWIKVD